MSEKTMEKIVALAKGRGFIYPGSEIYGGLANTWDYGNLGVELKNNVKKAWWQKFIQENKYNVGVGVVTNNFHVFRGVHLARHMGIREVCGISAPSDVYFLLNNMVREFFGVMKDLVYGNLL